MTPFRSLLLLVTGFWVLFATAPAFAQDEDPTVEMARQRFKEGIDFFDAKQFNKSRAAFLQAYALKKHPAVLLNLAQSELRSGHEADAADHFAEYLRDANEAKAEERQSAMAGLVDAKKVVAEVTIRVDQKDADIFVNNKSRGVSPLPSPVYLAPGTYTFTARKGGKEVTSSLTVEAGESASTRLALKPARATVNRDRAPAAGQAGSITPAPTDEARPMDDGAAGSWFWEHPVAWVTAGLAVVGVASGVGFSISAGSNYDSADITAKLIEVEAQKDQEPVQGICTRIGDIATRKGAARGNDYQNACTIYQNNVDRGDSMKTAAIAGFVVGGAALIGTVIYYAVDVSSSADSASADPKRTVKIAVSPVLGPSFTGLTLTGAF